MTNSRSKIGSEEFSFLQKKPPLTRTLLYFYSHTGPTTSASQRRSNGEVGSLLLPSLPVTPGHPHTGWNPPFHVSFLQGIGVGRWLEGLPCLLKAIMTLM